MKKLLLAVILLVSLVSCTDKGVSEQYLTGEENNLPQELKGLKIYSVSTGGGGFVQVAVLNNQVNSVTYPKGKTQETVIMVNKGKVIQVSEVLSENDSLIVCRK